MTGTGGGRGQDGVTVADDKAYTDDRGIHEVEGASDPPFLFLLGSGRSGTTLLLAMLDSHPDLAIPAETGGIMLQICGDPPLSGTGVLDIDAFLDRLLQNERFRLWGLDAAALRREPLRGGAEDRAAGVTCHLPFLRRRLR